jgi:hypothetical protein
MPPPMKVDQYRIQYLSQAGVGKIKAKISCFFVEKEVGRLYFFEDGYNLSPASITADNVISMSFHISQFNDVIGILRYEEPVFISFNEKSNMGTIYTGKEPTGEEETP